VIYDEEDLNNYIMDIFNGLTYTLVKYYDFSVPDLLNFFAKYEQETEYKLYLELTNMEHFEEFKKRTKEQYYKDLFRSE
jgi:hypothetical protein